MKKSGEEASFHYRSYGKGELASLYTPNVLQKTAVMKLNDWIQTAPGLAERLGQTGLTPYAKRYTPAQVRMIVDVLGEP